MKNNLYAFFIASVLLIAAAVACNNSNSNKESYFIDASELQDLPDTKVNVWDDYDKRSKVVAQLSHNDKVFLISESGDGAEIETEDGTRGWINKAFISKSKK